MSKLLAAIISPIISLMLFTLGIGLLTTLLTVRLHAEGGGAGVIGFLTAAYYFGMVIGSFQVGHILRRVGHIRVFACFAAILCASVLLCGLFVQDWVWVILRAISGYCLAGLYVAIQSWLLVVSPKERRGQILAVYMLSFYAAMAFGQFLLNVSDPETIVPFCIVALLVSISIVPLSITSAASPSANLVTTLSLRKLYRLSPSGIVGSGVAGAITSVIYGLMPLFAKQLNFPNNEIALVMGLIIFGAMFIQYPLGRLSDYFDRKNFLIIASIATIAISLCLLGAVYVAKPIFFALAFVFGGVAFTLYPLSISHTCDHLQEKNEIVAVTQGLLLANGIGSIIGPVIVPVFIYGLGSSGLFVFFAVISFVLTLFFLWRKRKQGGRVVGLKEGFILAPPAPVSSKLDARNKD